MKKAFWFMVGFMLVFSVGMAQAADKELTFEWEHSGIGVAEFRIYKSMASGVYDHANDLLVSLPFTGDSEIYQTDAMLTSPDGQEITWYFVCTARDSDGNESVHSNEVFKIIDFEAPDAPFSFSVTIKVTP